MASGEPTFRPIFGAEWSSMPVVLRKHYANRPFSHDVVVAEGVMQVETSWLMRLLAPALRLLGAFPPFAGSNIPVKVTFRSEPDSQDFILDREFAFPERGTFRFRSSMEPCGGNEVIEWMRGGIGWRSAISFADHRVRLSHRGYAIRLFGRHVRLPLEAFIGRGEAWEEALDAERFAMAMTIRHPIFGNLYGYSGTFTVREMSLDA